MVTTIGLIGAGKMGMQLAQYWRKKDYTVLAYDPNEEAKTHLKVLNCAVMPTIHQLADAAPVIWLMVPHEIVDQVLEEITPHAQPGTIIIDGGNSNFNDSMRRANQLKKYGITFLDCGVSGGIVAADGFSLMIGGDRAAYDATKHFFETLAAPLKKDEHGCPLLAYAYIGPSGAGHYTKMVHNGIEYALMEVYGEGFQLLREGKFKNLDLQEISRIWQAAVIKSELLNLAHYIFANDQRLTKISGEVGETGMGQWTVDEAKKEQIPVKLIEDAVNIRDLSHKTGGNFATKLVAMLRHEFGGHSIKKVE